MLGMVFTEFVELMEQGHSPAVADRVLTRAASPHGGCYTAVGSYPHQEMVAMVGALSAELGVAVPELLRQFGGHLLRRFTVMYPAMFVRHANPFDFLAAIDGEIHVQVRKLYASADLPRFTVLHRDEQTMDLLYESPRAMDDLAHGMIEALFVHYRQPCTICREPVVAPPGTVFQIASRAT
jgi:hypothetical protein